jgi:acetolactate synthase regulatory subunit
MTMCRVNITIDQSIHTLAPVFDLVEGSTFYIRSIRVAPVAWSRKADVYLSLGGGSKRELDMLLSKLRELPAVQSTQHNIPPIWASGTSVMPESGDRPRLELADAGKESGDD